MRILHVGKYYPPHLGGTEKYTQELVRRQSALNEVTVIVANNSRHTRRETMDGASLIRVARYGIIRSMPVTPNLPWQLRMHPADIIHIHMPNPTASLSYLLSDHKGKLILTHHADTVGRKMLRNISDPIDRETMRRASKIIVTSQRYMDSSEVLAPFRHKCVEVPLGINPQQFAGDCHEEVAALKARYGERLLLCIGRLVAFKGFQYAIQAMRDVDAMLLIAGEGPMETALRKLATDCDVAHRIHFIGPVCNSRVPAFIKASQIVLFPSVLRTESFGYVQLEAMACGVPIINTAIESGAPDVSPHGVTGLTVPARDGAALSNAINILLNDSDLCKRFGENGRRRVQEKYTLDAMVNNTMAVYASVMERQEPKLTSISGPRLLAKGRLLSRALRTRKRGF